MLKDINWHLGTGGSYSLERVDVYALYVWYAKGADAHAGHALTMGVSVPFER